MTGIASLGMYDPPWMRAANDALWSAVAGRLRAAGLRHVPVALTRDRPLGEIWRDPALLLAQTCGYPLVTTLRDAVAVVGAPVYDLPGCEGARHRSFLVVAEDAPFAAIGDLAGRRAAMNGPDSNTGMNLFRHTVAPFSRSRRFFGEIVESGSHLASMESVGTGRADVAAIDCVTFGLACRHRPDLASRLRILGETTAGPTLPFVTRAGRPEPEVDALRVALNEALGDAASGPLQSATGLRRVEPARFEDYRVLLRYERQAGEAGYPVLA